VAYDLVAEGFGALGLKAATPDSLTAAIRTGLDSGRPTLIQAPIDVGGPGLPR
jgi:thiamine pyrophosphate-dependent acetolactate synthase large subunit-like protein